MNKRSIVTTATMAIAMVVFCFAPAARADVDSLPGEPTGEHIVVTNGFGGAASLMILTPGAPPRSVGETLSGDRPAWSPDGGSLVFSRWSSSGPPELYVAELGGPARQLTSGHTYGAGTPAWSPDGRTIAFTSSGQTQTPFFALPDPNAEVFVIRPDGTGEARLSSQLSMAAEPAWAPDGSALAVTGATYVDSVYQILVLDPITGLETRRLTNDLDGSHVHPAWSPDGRTVAYAISPRSDPVDGRRLPWVLAVVGADGTNPHVIASDANGRYLYAPTWTPDGRIVYVSAASGDDGRLEVMNADGTDRHALTGSLYNPIPAVAPVLFTDSERDTNGATPATRPGDPPARPAATSGHPLDANAAAPSLLPAEFAANVGQGSSDSGLAAPADAVAAGRAPRGGPLASSNGGGLGPAVAVVVACVFLALSVALADHWRRSQRGTNRS